jgi:hypothetical protein
MFYRFPMTTRVILCIETLGFEAFGSKTPFLQVLDCHNSPQRAGSSLGELEVRTGGAARLQLATASSNSPWRAGSLASRVGSVIAHCLLVLGGVGTLRFSFLRVFFYESKPLKPRSYFDNLSKVFLRKWQVLSIGIKAWKMRE